MPLFNLTQSSCVLKTIMMCKGGVYLCTYDIFQDAVSRSGVNDVLKIVKRMYMDL